MKTVKKTTEEVLENNSQLPKKSVTVTVNSLIAMKVFTDS